MQTVKFLIGILIVQVITAVLIYISPINLDDPMSLLRLVLPLFFVALMVAFWFSSLSLHLRKDSEHKMKTQFAKEREEIKVKAEKDKHKVVKQSQKEIAREAKMTHAKANFKVGAAFAGALGVGALFIFAQFLTAGLLTLTAAGGVAGGYYWRGKRIGQDKMKVLAPKETQLLK
jgi:Flp pilus assembly protein TadB